MCNCGNKRESIQQLSSNISVPANNGFWKDVLFTYTGKTALTVTGGVTGRRYRFTQPGDVQLIDYRDASGMMHIPMLKKN